VNGKKSSQTLEITKKSANTIYNSAVHVEKLFYVQINLDILENNISI
jgi:hypothetical protein